MKLKFTRKTWYFFLLAAAAVSMLGGFALLGIEYSRGKPIQRQLQLVCVAEVLRTVFWLLTRYAGMAGLAFWTNLLFVLLACARGWAALTLYKLQEEEL